ncbi:MAG: hypothetical protein LBS74_04090 [Oscillospiraceae bacterium]|jgi:hypothetical protein|nr:hypothetical protein [Oscillospiraceae bacterium]
MLKKAFFKAVIFTLLLTLCIYGAGLVFQPKRVQLQPDTTAKVRGFYAEGKKSLDVVFCGTSKVFCLINPNQLWLEQGFTSYDFATNEQPLWITYYYVKEALKYQKPKLIVLDVYCAAYGEEEPRNAVTRAGLDFLSLSPNKLEAALDNDALKELPSYVFPLLRYHDRWSSLSKDDYKYAIYNAKNPMHGYSPMYMVNPQEKPEGLEGQPIGTLAPRAEEYLLKTIELIKSEGVDLLLLNTPYCISPQSQSKFNRVAQIAEEQGVPFLDCNLLLDDIGLDYSKDYIDLVHTNVVGSEKIGKYVGDYIKQNYTLPDSRGNPAYTWWEESAQLWLNYNAERLPTLGTAEADEKLEGLLL